MFLGSSIAKLREKMSARSVYFKKTLVKGSTFCRAASSDARVESIVLAYSSPSENVIYTNNISEFFVSSSVNKSLLIN